MPTNPPKKRAPAKSAAKKSTAKRSPKKTAAKKAKSAPKTTASKRESDTLQNVARTIGATLGSFAKTTSGALKAAKQAIPNFKHSPKDE